MQQVETIEGTTESAGVRRIPKTNQIRGLKDEVLRDLFVAADTLPLERSIYEREIIRREAETKWEADIKGERTCEVAIARAFTLGWVNRYILGETTAAKAAWEVSRVLKITYKDGELIVSAGFAYHDAAGVEVNQGMVNGNAARNSVPAVCAAGWRATFDGAPSALAALSEQIKLAMAEADPMRAVPKTRAPKAPREPKVKTERVRAPKAERKAPVRRPTYVPLPVQDQRAAMAARFAQ